MNLAKTMVVFFLFATMVAAVPAASAVCSNASINGVYGVLSTGLNGSGQPASSVDRVAVDGAGNLSGSSTKSIDGTIVTFTFTGTYQINKDCTGSATFNNQDGSTIHANIYLNNGNKGAFLIQTDANHVESSVVVAQGAAVCTDLGVKHTYAVQLTGTNLSKGQVAGAGRLTLNGTGLITGSVTVSIAGSIGNALPVTGTYSINSDCTGAAQITPHGLSPTNLSLLVVGADKQIMAIETDSNTIVTGMFQQ